MASDEASKLERFLQWLMVNKVKLRGCSIKYCDADKGFDIYTSADPPEDGVLLVVQLDLAITPMRVLTDPVIGTECRKMFEDGDVDDRFLMILFLTVERLLENYSWKPMMELEEGSGPNMHWSQHSPKKAETTSNESPSVLQENFNSVYNQQHNG